MSIQSRKAAEKARVRALIIKAATKMYDKLGYDGVSLRKIASKISYSPATIYLHFKDKDELFLAIQQQCFEQFLQHLSQCAGIEDPLDRLEKMGILYVEFAIKNKESYNLMFLNQAPMAAIPGDSEWETGARSFFLLRDTIQECMDLGLLSFDDIDAATMMIWSQIHGMVSLLIRDRLRVFPADRDSEDLIHTAIGLFYQALDRFKKS